MKSLVKTCLLILFCSAAFSAFSNDLNPKLNLRKGFAKTVVLNLDFEKTTNFQLRLKDANDLILLKEEVNGVQTFGKIYNLKNLPDGNYFLEIEDDRGISVSSIRIEKHDLIIEKNNEFRLYKPVIFQKDNRILVNMLLSKSPETTINIYNSENVLIFSEKAENQTKLEKAFDFAAMNWGIYHFEILNAGRVFRSSVEFDKD